MRLTVGNIKSTVASDIKFADGFSEDKIISWLQEFGQSTEKEGCQKRLIEFLGVSQDQIAKCYS